MTRLLSFLLAITFMAITAAAQTIGGVTTTAGKSWTSVYAPDINDDFTKIYQAPFVMMSAQSGFSAERVLGAGSMLSLTDAGAGLGATLAVSDAELLCIGNLTAATDAVPYFTAATPTCSTMTVTSAARTVLDDTSVGAMLTTLGGQPLDADLTSIAALTTTAYGRGLLTLANNAALVAEVDPSFLTPAEGNAAYQPLDSDLTSWAAITRASGFDTFTATPSSTNFAALLTGEIGTGPLVFLGTPADDQVPVGDSASATTWRTLPSCSGATTDKLLYNQSTNTFSCGTDQSGSGLVVTGTQVDNALPIANSASTTVWSPAVPNCAGATTDKLLYTQSTHTFSCGSDQGGGGGGDNIKVEDSDNAGTFTSATDANFEDSGDINFVLNTGVSPNEISAVLRSTNLTSWRDITRASGFDTFVATPSAANFATLVTGESYGLTDNELAALAGTTAAANKLPYFDSTTTMALADLSANMRTFMTTPSSANLATLVTDDNFTLTDNELSCIAGLTAAADKFAYFSGTTTCALADLSSAMRTFMTTSSVANLSALLTDDAAGWTNFVTNPTSANFATFITNETGTGNVVMSADPALTGNPTVPTQTAGDNDTSAASTAFVTTAVVNKTESFCFAISDETTAMTTGTAKVTFRMPYAFTLTGIRGSLNTASSSGSPIWDVNEAGTSIMTTNKILIDASEKTSVTAVTAPTITDTALADDAEITADVDTAGTGAKGGKICLIGHQ